MSKLGKLTQKKKEIKISMQYIRDTYNIPIKRGMKVCVGGKIGWIKELR